ncbi:MAG TPA: M28 family peptidase [Candidatus Binataceae bacterium]
MSDDPAEPASISGPIALIIIVLVAAYAVVSIAPPAAQPITAPETKFSAARAMRDVRAIAVRPHPLGSADNARVRDYLLRRLDGLGAKSEQQTVTAASARRRPHLFATAHNIIGQIGGTDSTGTVMLAGHYDSVPSGPGAGDDASAVAAILETVRAIEAGPPLRNDLLILFTDGEELGLVGAKGFVENFPALPKIKVVLNFEMRGDEGPSLMFQTSDPNAWLIDQFAHAADYPRAGSFSSAIYKRLSNDTDLTEFMAGGLAGMNFAASGGLPRYHTALDNAALLDQRSLQHQGSYALELAQRFGNIRFDQPDRSQNDARNEVYFSVGNHLIHYGERAALVLAIMLTALVAIVIAFGIRDGRLSAPGIVAGFFVFIGAIAIAVTEGFAMWHVMAILVGWRRLPSMTSYGARWFGAASTMVALATLLTLYAWLVRFTRAQNMGAGALTMWTLLMLLSTSQLAGASYLLMWPLIFAALAMYFVPREVRGDSVQASTAALCAILALAPAAIILVPLVTVGAEATPMFLMLAAFGVALIIGVAIPYLEVLSAGYRWHPSISIALGALAIVFLAVGTSASGFNAHHPRPDSIFYVLDAESAAARWVSVDPRPDHFTAQFFQHRVRGGKLAAITGSAAPFTRLNNGRTIEGDAPAVKLPPPELKVLDDVVHDGVRIVKVHIGSARHAPTIWMTLPDTVRVIDAAVDGKSPGGFPSDGWAAWYWSVPERGFDLQLKVKGGGELTLTLIDQSDGLPATPGEVFTARPDDVMPTPFLFFDSATLVRNTYTLGAADLSRR